MGFFPTASGAPGSRCVVASVLARRRLFSLVCVTRPVHARFGLVDGATRLGFLLAFSVASSGGGSGAAKDRGVCWFLCDPSFSCPHRFFCFFVGHLGLLSVCVCVCVRTADCWQFFHLFFLLVFVYSFFCHWPSVESRLHFFSGRPQIETHTSARMATMIEAGYSMISRQEASRTIADVTRAHPNIQAMIATISSRIDPVKTAAAVSMALVAHPTAFAPDLDASHDLDSACDRGHADAERHPDGKRADDDDGVSCRSVDASQPKEKRTPHQTGGQTRRRRRHQDEQALAAAVPLHLAIDVCVPRACTLLIEVAATKIHKRVAGAVRTWQSAQRDNVVADFGVYKREGFDAALAAVRGLPGMSGLSAREVAQRGASRASNHPRDMYNLRYVDVVLRSESGARDGLIATHRGIDTALVPDGLWTRLSVEVGEEDAGAHGAAIVAILAALVRSSDPGRANVPSVRDLDWISLNGP
nr:hypothetical protein [Pandoravirus massiliensis]